MSTPENHQPWWPQGAIDALRKILVALPRLSVFEYGSGESSLWLASLCSKLVTVEHAAEWTLRLLPKLPEHATLIHFPVGDPYCHIQLEFQSDVLIIDGRKRKRCAELALKYRPRVILWDDIQRDYYQCTADQLKDAYEFKDFPDAVSTHRAARIYKLRGDVRIDLLFVQ